VWDDNNPTFRLIRHAWRVEVAHGSLGCSAAVVKSVENAPSSATGWLQVACIPARRRAKRRPRRDTTLRHRAVPPVPGAGLPAPPTGTRSLTDHPHEALVIREIGALRQRTIGTWLGEVVGAGSVCL
jgi:hypothetical protein